MDIGQIDSEKMLKHYGQIGQILDGLWFLQLEKEFGFEKAIAIDEQVWKVFPPKEAKRIKNLLGFEKPTINDIQNALKLAIFNQSLEWTLDEVSSSPMVIRIRVKNCKTLKGMQAVGRTQEQINRVCYEIGIAYFESFLNALSPGVQVKCVHCPGRGEKTTDDVCAWEFQFNS
jgi:hypothetical protein